MLYRGIFAFGWGILIAIIFKTLGLLTLPNKFWMMWQYWALMTLPIISNAICFELGIKEGNKNE